MGKILFAEQDGVHVLKFIGEVRLTLGPTISTFLAKLESCDHFQSMIIDLSETETIDSTALGLIAKIGICTREYFDSGASIVSPREDITRVLSSMAMEQVCVITSDDVVTEASGLQELPTEITSEEVLRDQVLDAHKTLMALGDQNFDKFQDLVEVLENEKEHEPSGGKPGQPTRATGT
ncbi:MAG: STAS domain-containing protein [Pseudomonadales bacterium]|nr:STAS domain-containing protein [Pseudomonadales bacterium]